MKLEIQYKGITYKLCKTLPLWKVQESYDCLLHLPDPKLEMEEKVSL